MNGPDILGEDCDSEALADSDDLAPLANAGGQPIKLVDHDASELTMSFGVPDHLVEAGPVADVPVHVGIGDGANEIYLGVDR